MFPSRPPVMGPRISNTIVTPQRLKLVVQTEFFIKTGLATLGASLILGWLQARALGIAQTVIAATILFPTESSDSEKFAGDVARPASSA